MSRAGGLSEDDVWFRYKFTFPDGKTKEFHIALDDKHLSLVSEKKPSYPEWTRLTNHQCTNCPLREDTHPRCPIAENLVEVVDSFKQEISYEKVDVEISTPSRSYRKETSLQIALSSLIGIYMVTSGCPIMDKLRPLVRTHLPFATLRETTYRAMSMYLLAQFFLQKNGRSPDWTCEGLVNIYKEIRTVNKGFHERLLHALEQDAGLNAIIHLDCYADFTNMSLLEKGLEEIEEFFQAYLEEKPTS